MNLKPESIEWALTSVDRHGDTDLFPRYPETRALLENRERTVAKLSSLDLSVQSISPPRRFIVPKDDLSYRPATQLDLVDSLLFTALAYEYGQLIEARRRPRAEQSVFSYRFSPSVDGDLYSGQDPWNAFWSRCGALAAHHSMALILDISDFYNQVYHHTVENQLIEAGLPNPATKWIMKLLETVTAKVSRGIPVGPHPAHLLAESSLIPVDNSLAARGHPFGRFVDDIVVFLPGEEEARITNLEVAAILDKQQRLQLQRGKTRLLTSEELRVHCRNMIADRPISRSEKDLLSVIRKYSSGNPYRTVSINEISKEDLRAFKPRTIQRILKEYLAKPSPDFVRIRWFLRRLAQVGHPAAVSFCLEHFDRLIPALSDMCHYFVAVGAQKQPLTWPEIGKKVLDLLNARIIQANEYFQLSLTSLFSRRPELDHVASLIKGYANASPYLRREVILAAAASGQGDWLRELKEDYASMDPWTRHAFLFATKNLPPEERKVFLKFTNPASVLEELLVDWAKQ